MRLNPPQVAALLGPDDAISATEYSAIPPPSPGLLTWTTVKRMQVHLSSFFSIHFFAYLKDEEEGVPFVTTANRADADSTQQVVHPRSAHRSLSCRLPLFDYDCDDEPIGPLDPAIPRLCARSPSPLTSAVQNVYDPGNHTSPIAILGQVITLLELEGGAEH
ncbi:hypothetical protein CSAL01_11013 [Colletotrichum salicis]|uniref:Uncharacterized protein n=1 Tax=Colletotrichum salicis TaxID=1209931 RepID=A0A135U3K8_9PEZI|nr:hypothetical protein CSAL01_11013 [Colletotrichum salicis]